MLDISIYVVKTVGVVLDYGRPVSYPSETSKAKRNRWMNVGFFPNSVRPRVLAHGGQQSKKKS